MSGSLAYYRDLLESARQNSEEFAVKKLTLPIERRWGKRREGSDERSPQ